MNTPCQDRIEMAVRARARSILRRWFSTHQTGRATAEEFQWLKHNLPEVITDTSLERALRLAGPAFDQATSRYIASFYESGYGPDLRLVVMSALAKESEGVA